MVSESVRNKYDEIKREKKWQTNAQIKVLIDNYKIKQTFSFPFQAVISKTQTQAK